MIMVFNTIVLNDDMSRCFFFQFFEIFSFQSVRGIKGQKIVQNEKITITSVTRYISGTVKHMIMIFGTFVLNDDISRCFFHFFEIFTFGAAREVNGQKLSKMKNSNYIRHVPYLRNSIAYNHDHDFW